MILLRVLIRFACLAWIAYPPATYALLVGISSSTDSYYEINPTTGIATFLSTSSADANYAGLAYLNGSFYASDLFTFFPQVSSNLYSVDPYTGTEVIVNNQGGQYDWHGLAANQSANVLYTVAFDDDTLKTISPDGTITTIAPVNINARGLAYDNASGTLYALNGGNLPGYAIPGLYTIDTTTGVTSYIGQPSTGYNMAGLAFDETAGILYLNDGNGLYSVNTNNGLSSFIGFNGVSGIDGLAWADISTVPLPSTVFLFASGLLGVIGIAMRRKTDGPSGPFSFRLYVWK